MAAGGEGSRRQKGWRVSGCGYVGGTVAIPNHAFDGPLMGDFAVVGDCGFW